MSRFFFLHVPSNESWEAADPIQWFLDHAQEPVLERARKGLLELAPTDKDRIIRLVTRRCDLNLIEFLPERAVVHYWGKDGLGDLRPFFKRHQLARKEFSVFLSERKHEVIQVTTGAEFLYGEKIAESFPLDLYRQKWNQREIEEGDDWSPAPATWSGYAWKGVESNRIPWAALKSAWRRTSPGSCLNCDEPTLLTNFGFPWWGMFNRYPRFIFACGDCRRSFKDNAVKNVGQWIVENLDAEVWPDYDMIWDRRVKLERKA